MDEFRTDYTFSPQLLAAIEQYSSHSLLAMREADTWCREHSIPREEAGDIRDFSSVILVRPEMDDDGVRQLARTTTEKYFDPNGRAEVLDAFYDTVENLRFDQLDLSVMQGRDTGPRGAQGLTSSERDLMRLLQVFRSTQAVAVKERENPEYCNARFADPVRRADYLATADTVYNMLPYILVVLNRNGLSQNLQPAEPIPTVFSETALKAMPKLAQGLYQTLRDIRADAPVRPISFTMGADLSEAPNFAQPGLSATDRARADQQAARLFDSTIGVVLENKSTLELLKGSVLTTFDLVFVDGRSVRDRILERYPAADSTELKQQMQAEAVRALADGKSHVDLMMPYMGQDGAAKRKLVPLHADLHQLDAAEKKANHGWFRRTFLDWGPFKIETRADLADRLFAEDTPEAIQQRETAAQASVEARIEQVAIDRQAMETMETRTRKVMNEFRRDSVEDARLTESQERIRTSDWERLLRVAGNPNSFDPALCARQRLSTRVVAMDMRAFCGLELPPAERPAGYVAPADPDEAMARLTALEKRLARADLRDSLMGKLDALEYQMLDSDKPRPMLRGQLRAVADFCGQFTDLPGLDTDNPAIDSLINAGKQSMYKLRTFADKDSDARLVPMSDEEQALGETLQTLQKSCRRLVEMHPALRDLPKGQALSELRKERDALTADYRAFGERERMSRLREGGPERQTEQPQRNRISEPQRRQSLPTTGGPKL